MSRDLRFEDRGEVEIVGKCAGQSPFQSISMMLEQHNRARRRLSCHCSASWKMGRSADPRCGRRESLLLT